jgi:hypothetical protein
MKMIAGALALACSNRSRTRLAPTPTNISTKSEPEIEKNGTPASPATARASSVLPGPRGTEQQAPLGIFAPIAWNLAGSSRKSLISPSSSTASSAPATSANVTFGSSLLTTLALDLPKLHDPAAAALHLRHEEEEQAEDEHERQDRQEDADEHVARLRVVDLLDQRAPLAGGLASALLSSSPLTCGL